LIQVNFIGNRVWGAADRAVSDDYLSRNRLQISPRFPQATAPRVIGALVLTPDVIAVEAHAPSVLMAGNSSMAKRIASAAVAKRR